MPELPEVETVARQLAPLIVGRTVRALELLDPLLGNAPRPSPTGRRIEAVERIGKQVVIRLDGAPHHLAVHLRMTGRLLYSAEPTTGRLPHLRARLRFDRGELQFVDTRRFGTFTWVAERSRLAPAGIDPTGEGFSEVALRALLHRSPTALKVWLLRQDRLVGVGNIYASEICFEAGLSPFRAAGRLSRAESSRLHHAVRQVLTRAIEHSGTTFSDFQDAHGLTGSYQRYLKVYEREGQPCRRCGTTIRRRQQAQRSTYWCPRCQLGRTNAP